MGYKRNIVTRSLSGHCTIEEITVMKLLGRLLLWRQDPDAPQVRSSSRYSSVGLVRKGHRLAVLG